MPLILELSFDQVQERWVFYKLHIVELSFSQNIRGKKLASIHPWRIRHELNLCCIQCKWNTLGGKLSWQCGPCDRWSVGHIWDSYRIWLDNVLHNSFCCSWCNRFRWWVLRIPRTFQLATKIQKRIKSLFFREIATLVLILVRKAFWRIKLSNWKS